MPEDGTDQETDVVITQGLSNQQVATGCPLLLRVRFSGRPGRIRWLRDGLPLTDRPPRIRIATNDGEASCSIAQAWPIDNGVYECRLGQTGKASCCVTVCASQRPPRMLSRPSVSLRQPVGSSLHLACRATGNPSPRILWTRDGVSLKSATSTTAENSTVRLRIVDGEADEARESRLTLTAVEEADTGVYAATAENSCGSVTAACHVTVVASPSTSLRRSPVPFAPHFGDDILEELEAHYNDKVTFRCTVHGHPRPAVTWDRDGVPLSADDSVVVSHCSSEHSLTIPYVSQHHAGLYRIVASNQLGRSECFCELRVVDEPSSVCRSIGGVEEATMTELTASGWSLTSSIDDDQPGESPGAAAPEFPRIFRDVWLRAGQRLTLQCEIDACPAPQISWTFNGQPLPADHSRVRLHRRGRLHRLVIDAVAAIDSGRYGMTAENSVGSAACAAIVVVEDSDGRVCHQKVIRASTRSTNLRQDRPAAAWLETPMAAMLP